VTLSVQPDPHAPRPVKGRDHVLLVDLLKEGQVLWGRALGPVAAVGLLGFEINSLSIDLYLTGVRIVLGTG